MKTKHGQKYGTIVGGVITQPRLTSCHSILRCGPADWFSRNRKLRCKAVWRRRDMEEKKFYSTLCAVSSVDLFQQSDNKRLRGSRGKYYEVERLISREGGVFTYREWTSERVHPCWKIDRSRQPLYRDPVATTSLLLANKHSLRVLLPLLPN